MISVVLTLLKRKQVVFCANFCYSDTEKLYLSEFSLKQIRSLFTFTFFILFSLYNLKVDSNKLPRQEGNHQI